jgi:Domain of unknown function (DUF1707)
MTGAEQSPAPLSPAGTARASDADREAIAETLRVAAGEGRIDFEELDDRLRQAYSAKTCGQLRTLVADLPVQPAPVLQQDAAAEPGTLVLKTKTPNIKQSGRWAAPRRDRRSGRADRHRDRAPGIWPGQDQATPPLTITTCLESISLS